MIHYHPMKALEIIRKKIRETGEIPFVEFMQLALYDPQVGYYTSGMQKFGEQGDFVTAPEMTPLFGKTLARQIQEVFKHVTFPILLEFGAGSGKLCVDLLRELEDKEALPEQYWILEVSGDLSLRQKKLITQEIPHLASRVQWLTSWPTIPFEGVIIANEVLDAMPVHRFLLMEEGLKESYITLDEEGRLKEVYRSCNNERLQKYVKEILPAAAPYQSEVNLFLDSWIEQVSNILKTGAFFIFDYGFPRHEYYHPERQSGTLMCHYQHKGHINPLAHPGEEDITAHVDFTHVAEAAVNAQFHVAGFVNQASFLLMNGILELLEEMEDSIEKINAQQAVKKLVMPHEMGELFKVMALTKNFDFPLQGFQLHDKRASL